MLNARILSNDDKWSLLCRIESIRLPLCHAFSITQQVCITQNTHTRIDIRNIVNNNLVYILSIMFGVFDILIDLN